MSSVLGHCGLLVCYHRLATQTRFIFQSSVFFSHLDVSCFLPYTDTFLPVGSRGTERTVVMDKSKGVPVISVKTSGSKERVSIDFLTRVFSSFFHLTSIYISKCVLGNS